MDSSFLKLSESRIANWMGLVMDAGIDWTPGKHYVYISVPPRVGACYGDSEPGTVKRNQRVFLEAAATLQPRGRQFVEVEPSPELLEYGNASGIVRVHPEGDTQESRVQLGVWFQAHRNLDLSELKELVRLYIPY